MSWNPYDLDHVAQGIVLKVRERAQDPSMKSDRSNSKEDKLEKVKDVLNEAYKMRAACAFGLERFWGEHLRLSKKDEQQKAEFIADVWRAFVVIMKDAGITLPHNLYKNTASEAEIRKVTNQLWALQPQDRQAALAVLTNLCDSVVWWTQRLKPQKDCHNQP